MITFERIAYSKDAVEIVMEQQAAMGHTLPWGVVFDIDGTVPTLTPAQPGRYIMRFIAAGS